MSTLISAPLTEQAVRWRHDLHRHPELAFQERRTSDFIARLLSEWGYNVQRDYAQTGLIGSMKKGTSSKAIGIRADMDALPIHENSGLPHASSNAGIMHACGHEGHVSMALLAARVLADRDFDGTVHFIFQPAEENEAGARIMIEDGLFRNFDALPSMAAEDFAFMLQEKPGCYFWLGAARSGEDNPGLHSPRFDFNDAILPLGAAMWVALADKELCIV